MEDTITIDAKKYKSYQKFLETRNRNQQKYYTKKFKKPLEEMDELEKKEYQENVEKRRQYYRDNYKKNKDKLLRRQNEYNKKKREQSKKPDKLMLNEPKKII
jgi:hypothetical protein